MCVHDVQRHLHRVKGELVGEGSVEHLQVDIWALVPGEADIANLACLLGREHGLHSSTRGKDAARIGVADYLVKLHHIHVVGLQSLE